MVLTEILNFWNDVDGLTDVAGQLYAGEVPTENPDGTAINFPFTYMIPSQASYTYMMGSVYLEAVEVTFYTFTHGMDDCIAAIKLIRDSYAWKQLTFTDGSSSTFSIRPLSSDTSSQNVRDKAGLPVYRGSISFLFTTCRVEPAEA